MEATITYLHHNCFLVTCGRATLLFDYPGEALLSDEARRLARQALEGAAAYVFISHSHEDHCNPAVLDLAKRAESACFVVSYDVADMHPGFEPEALAEAGFKGVVVEPDEDHFIAGVDVLTFESTDLGVGFLLTVEGLNIYFGGDVAEWSWENASEGARIFAEEHYRDVLNKLKEYDIDIAFSNADGRLENWSGALRFVREIKPRLFTPMHCFGNLDLPARFAEAAAGEEVEVFAYSAPGDRRVYVRDGAE